MGCDSISFAKMTNEAAPLVLEDCAAVAICLQKNRDAKDVFDEIRGISGGTKWTLEETNGKRN